MDNYYVVYMCIINLQLS